MRMKYIILFILILLAIVLAMIARDNTPKEPMVEPNTKTYTSSEHGLSFTYKDKYFLEEKADPARLLSLVLMEDTAENRNLGKEGAVPREGPISMNVEVFANPQKKELKDWIMTESHSNWNLGNSTLEEANISGKNALSYQWSGLYEGLTVAVEYSEKVMLFSVTRLEPTDAILADFQLLLQSIQLE